MEYNIYCDESCHLPNDGKSIMGLGAIWCPSNKVRAIAENIREIKIKHGLSKFLEIKWIKVSPGKQDFYQDLVEYFFSEKDLHFRGLVVSDKAKLRHELYRQDHDTWYYKMFYVMLKEILNPLASYNIYLDIKDTKSADKVRTLQRILRNVYLDSTIKKVQNVRSHEIEQVQIADLILGGILYANRGIDTSPSKIAIVNKIKRGYGNDLDRTSVKWAKKFNIFIWEASWGNNK